MMADHQNARQRFRPIDSTALLTVQLTHVTGRLTQILTKQSKSSPIRVEDRQSLRKETVVCDAKGYEVKSVDGLILIESSFPITLLIGNSRIEVTGVFAFTGSTESIILVAETPTQVTITSIVSNL